MKNPAPHITLEQWRALTAVVEAGGYAGAARLLHKTQSSVTYAVQKLQALLDVQAFEIRGRKAVLTPTGELLYRRARHLLEEAGGLEAAARRLSAGWEAEIRLAVELIFPSWLLLQCLDRFGLESPHTRIELHESVLAGTSEALRDKRVELAIAGSVPPGFAGEPLMQLRFSLVAHPQHPLHQLGRPVTARDLQAHCHLVVRETGSRRDTPASIETQRRWTVSHLSTSVQAVAMGYGFAWLPDELIRAELKAGRLKPLSVRGGGERYVQLYLILADAEAAGPGVLRLAQILREATAAECPLAAGRRKSVGRKSAAAVEEGSTLSQSRV
ncbi:MAG: LysR family transcriptional regulator [Burkholderiales bacterium]|nr:LysR family transcriptional regulator [Burkholderiales bacterium]ODU69694.1 MAG: LysR family transcriptional regulator [Lautropia sp. SCN 66-9]